MSTNQKPSNKPCSFFQRGKCINGQNCRFVHENPHENIRTNIQAPPPKNDTDFILNGKNRILCRGEAMGHCNFDETCYFAHIKDIDFRCEDAHVWYSQQLTAIENENKNENKNDDEDDNDNEDAIDDAIETENNNANEDAFENQVAELISTFNDNQNPDHFKYSEPNAANSQEWWFPKSRKCTYCNGFSKRSVKCDGFSEAGKFFVCEGYSENGELFECEVDDNGEKVKK